MSIDELKTFAEYYNYTIEDMKQSIKDLLLTGAPRISFLGVRYSWDKLKKVYDNINKKGVR